VTRARAMVGTGLTAVVGWMALGLAGSILVGSLRTAALAVLVGAALIGRGMPDAVLFGTPAFLVALGGMVGGMLGRMQQAWLGRPWWDFVGGAVGGAIGLVVALVLRFLYKLG